MAMVDEGVAMVDEGVAMVGETVDEWVAGPGEILVMVAEEVMVGEMTARKWTLTTGRLKWHRKSLGIIRLSLH